MSHPVLEPVAPGLGVAGVMETGQQQHSVKSLPESVQHEFRIDLASARHPDDPDPFRHGQALQSRAVQGRPGGIGAEEKPVFPGAFPRTG